LAQRFKTKTRDAWCALLEGTDACVAPVLAMDEAPLHKHLQARATFIDVEGVVQPAPAPRFSRTVLEKPAPPQEMSRENTDAALAAWIAPAEVAKLRSSGILN
jgi:crotonobetainyl-CoA:carnitine CoA-transferase CaiB-like acyl-CoA transferase